MTLRLSWQATMQTMQEQVNQGAIIVAVWQNPTGESGHVMGLVPGEVQYSGDYKGKVVKTMDTGSEKRSTALRLSKCFGKDKRKKLNFLDTKGRLKNN